MLVCENSEDSAYSVIAVVYSEGIEGRPGRGWVCGTKTTEIGMQAFLIIWDIVASSSIYHGNTFGSYLPS